MLFIVGVVIMSIGVVIIPRMRVPGGGCTPPISAG